MTRVGKAQFRPLSYLRGRFLFTNLFHLWVILGVMGDKNVITTSTTAPARKRRSTECCAHSGHFEPSFLYLAIEHNGLGSRSKVFDGSSARRIVCYIESETRVNNLAARIKVNPVTKKLSVEKTYVSSIL